MWQEILQISMWKQRNEHQKYKKNNLNLNLAAIFRNSNRFSQILLNLKYFPTIFLIIKRFADISQISRAFSTMFCSNDFFWYFLNFSEFRVGTEPENLGENVEFWKRYKKHNYIIELKKFLKFILYVFKICESVYFSVNKF